MTIKSYSEEYMNGMKTLFKSTWIDVLETPSGYTYTHCPKLKNGNAVAVLGYRFTDDTMEFLLRREVLPAHGMEHSTCSLTGCCEDDDVMVDAIRELKEESGYEVKRSEVQYLGITRPSKSSDTVVHLFAVNLTGKEAGEATGDGTDEEESAYCIWSDHKALIKQNDPLNHVAFMRLMAVAGGDITIKKPQGVL